MVIKKAGAAISGKSSKKAEEIIVEPDRPDHLGLVVDALANMPTRVELAEAISAIDARGEERSRKLFKLVLGLMLVQSLSLILIVVTLLR